MSTQRLSEEEPFPERIPSNSFKPFGPIERAVAFVDESIPSSLDELTEVVGGFVVRLCLLAASIEIGTITDQWTLQEAGIGGPEGL